MDALIETLRAALGERLLEVVERASAAEPETGLPSDHAWVLRGDEWEIWVYEDEVDVRPAAVTLDRTEDNLVARVLDALAR